MPMESHLEERAPVTLLLFLDMSLSADVLRALLEWEQERFDQATGHLIQEGVLTLKPGGMLGLASDAGISELKDRLRPGWSAFLEKEGQPGTFFAYVRHTERGEQLDALTDLHLFCRRLAERAEEQAAIFCYNRLLDALIHLPMRSAPVEDIRRYIALCLEVQALTFYFLHAVDAAIRMLFRARGIAHAIGDLRSIALINLAIGSMAARPSGRHNSPRLHALMRRGVASIQMLGDEDILEQASLYLGIYHFLEGRYVEALSHFAQAGQASTAWELRQNMLTIYTSTCCAYLGEFDTGLSIVATGWRNAQLSGHNLAAGAIRTQLASLHFQHGNQEEGLGHLNEVITSVQSGLEPVTWAWSQQTLALYHFLQGHVTASHAVLRNCMRRFAELGSRRPIYLFPWMLELLCAYEENNLPPVEVYPYEQELEHALHGPHRLLRAVGLRLKTRTCLRAGNASPEELEDIRKNLSQALTIAREIGDQYEIIHSSLALSEFHLNWGDRQNAMHHASEALRGCLRYGRFGVPVWPEAVLELMAEMPTPEIEAEPESVLNQVQNALTMLGGTNGTETEKAEENGSRAMSLEEFQRGLLKNICTALGATRGALFRYTPPFFGESTLPTVALFSLAGQIRPNALNDMQDFMHVVLRDHKCGLERRSRDGVVQFFLGLPLSASPETGYGLYLEGAFFQNVAICLSSAFLDRLQALIERECALFHRFHSTFEAQNKERSRALGQKSSVAPDDIQFRCEAMERCLLRADLAAEADTPVLLQGESGVGKKLLGRRIHQASGRSGPFITVSLSGIPEDRFESEFLGHEKGAFTGALRQKQGLFELADKGTLLLDEVGDIPPHIQAKLLRVLQESAFMRVGGTRPINSEFRLICATNRDLLAEVQRGQFRRDLYYRISVIPITLPPLREREGDVIHLAQYFLEYYARKNKLATPKLGAQDIARLLAYSWPGNVAELRNVMERAVILSRNGSLRLSLDLPFPAASSTEAGGLFTDLDGLPSLKELQGRYIAHVLKQLNWKIDGPDGAAQILGLKRSSLYNRIKALGLRRPDAD